MSIFCFISLNINEKYYFKMFLITWNTGSLLEIICFLKLIMLPYMIAPWLV